ncbi:hypothetical protein FB451DRAFT_1192391 [Mycena latifolia]|nr:hypothetical protein FB451DRAFT_1192391 [Mycena latifolia]
MVVDRRTVGNSESRKIDIACEDKTPAYMNFCMHVSRYRFEGRAVEVVRGGRVRSCESSCAESGTPEKIRLFDTGSRDYAVHNQDQAKIGKEVALDRGSTSAKWAACVPRENDSIPAREVGMDHDVDSTGMFGAGTEGPGRRRLISSRKAIWFSLGGRGRRGVSKSIAIAIVRYRQTSLIFSSVWDGVNLRFDVAKAQIMNRACGSMAARELAPEMDSTAKVAARVLTENHSTAAEEDERRRMCDIHKAPTTSQSMEPRFRTDGAGSASWEARNESASHSDWNLIVIAWRYTPDCLTKKRRASPRLDQGLDRAVRQKRV